METGAMVSTSRVASIFAIRPPDEEAPTEEKQPTRRILSLSLNSWDNAVLGIGNAKLPNAVTKPLKITNWNGTASAYHKFDLDSKSLPSPSSQMIGIELAVLHNFWIGYSVSMPGLGPDKEKDPDLDSLNTISEYSYYYQNPAFPYGETPGIPGYGSPYETEYLFVKYPGPFQNIYVKAPLYSYDEWSGNGFGGNVEVSLNAFLKVGYQTGSIEIIQAKTCDGYGGPGFGSSDKGKTIYKSDLNGFFATVGGEVGAGLLKSKVMVFFGLELGYSHLEGDDLKMDGLRFATDISIRM